MDLFVPAPAAHLFQSRSGVVVPSLVVPEDATGRVRHPGKLWNGIGQRAKLALTLTQLFGPLGNALLKFPVQLFQLPVLAVQLGKNADFRAQQVWNDRHRNVVNRATLVSFQAVGVRQMHAGNEDDGSLTKPRMLTNHLGQLKPVYVRHADVHQHHGDVMLE